MSSKQDYDEMAEVLLSQRRFMAPLVYNSLVYQVGQMYAKGNALFDKQKWHNACFRKEAA
jgi:hypothetical protein